MTSCVVQVQELSRRLLKRMRPSLAASTSASVEDLAANRDSATSEALLKVCKRQIESSPRSSAPAMMADEPLQEEIVAATPVSDVVAGQWPLVTGCEGVRKALTFLQTSRQHALMLMLQNHWERAVSVLEKIEKATESVSEQRRQVVIQQANAGRNVLVEKIQELKLTAPRRTVRFSDEVAVAYAEEMDRKCDEVSEPVREEMLVLRASRKIPHENLSEFWNE
ncbi:uncharacterized protein PITG_00467 [Phytophthora infestans T30-4]|uniref:Uncharacterized protein n=2 Tax=Phytophthora infestans TaxID=4787 RepID=D0MQW1_PHYIT|nr:uncharacterized protein PITG_00467 [Phytophthora infestans T30-4]EEY57880.1 conserved hypothetical protein [Phytophthora infestans T30-4]KAF4033414.1 hypothetical protein GN244_ATG14750 [Phytophthora infestans]KAF4133792.1 hypothetical protein GN958_ATG17129 [Phytophthora infestans]|eukprot:XP_002909066.1 conserved hypothetical protein [Phytophthora infestans T30-4]